MRSHSFIGTCLALVLCVIPPGAMAQSEGASAAPSAGASNPIAIIDQDRLLSASRYGQRMGQEIEAAGAALVAENRRIEGQLTEEELRLTAQRANMDADAFRPLAEEFDARVESIRAAQEAKSRALQAQAEAARAAFPGWSGATAYLRGQIVYRLAEMLEGRRGDLADGIRATTGASRKKAESEVDRAIERVITEVGRLREIAGGAPDWCSS